MKRRVLILVAAATLTGWKGYCPIRADVSSGGVIESSPDPTPAQQAAIDAANRQWQHQQTVLAAEKSAKQAAAYANQAAAYNNDQARQADRYASEAAHYADVAAGRVILLSATAAGQPAMTTEQATAYAAEDAALAKQAAQQAEVDFAVKQLEDERDGIIAQLKAKDEPDKANLEFQLSGLKEQATKLQDQVSQSEKANDHLRAKQAFRPKDPWRMLDGVVCNAKDESWFLFTGEVKEVRPNGILVHGDFGPPLEAGFGKRDYFVENFPVQSYPLADGEAITGDMGMVAHMSEKASVYQFTNTAIDFRVSTVRRLDYGKIVATPPVDLAEKWSHQMVADASGAEATKQLEENQREQAGLTAKILQMDVALGKETGPVMAAYEIKIKAVPEALASKVKAAEEAKKQAVLDKVLKNNQDLADKGDPYGLRRMGERYRDGEGVTKDLAKAKDYLQKAAAAGDPAGADELKNLPAN
jgi:hypothetical protein